MYPPPPSSSVPCSSQGDQRGGPGHRDSTVVAPERVVSPGVAAPDRPPSVAVRARRSPSRSRRLGSPRPPQTPLSRLETLSRSLHWRGVSREAAAAICTAHRPSTRTLYHAKRESFCRWCSRWEKDPLHPSIRSVLSYLQHLRQRGLKHTTILSHISALSSCTSKVDGVPVGRHPFVAKWVVGDRSQNPPRRSLVPKWDLSVVLAALTEKPFEPLRQATPRLLTLKTLFLLAASSARRVSELHALCIDPPFLIQNPLSFRLAPNPAFLLKTSTEVALSSDIELSSFYPEPSSPLERGSHLMCPVIALRIYLQRTACSRGQNRSLFVHWDEGRVHHPVSKRWISSALTEAICAAYWLYRSIGSIGSILTLFRYGAWQPPGPS